MACESDLKLAHEGDFEGLHFWKSRQKITTHWLTNRMNVTRFITLTGASLLFWSQFLHAFTVMPRTRAHVQAGWLTVFQSGVWLDRIQLLHLKFLVVGVLLLKIHVFLCIKRFIKNADLFRRRTRAAKGNVSLASLADVWPEPPWLITNITGRVLTMRPF